MIRALMFDLDDTLYRELDFIAGGYRAVAESVASGCGGAWMDLHAMMMAALAREGRYAAMDAVLERYPASGLQVADLVRVYRSHVPTIQLLPGYGELLQELRSCYRIGIITDGAPEVQKAKCTALGLDRIADNILCTWENGKDKEKPHPLPFRQMLDRFGVMPAEALFIGDNLTKDIRGARGVGMRAVHVLPPGIKCDGQSAQESDFVVESLAQLPLILRQLEDGDEGA